MDTLPDDINPDKQKISIKNMRENLLKNIIPISAAKGDQKKIQVYTEINQFLENRVDKFLEILDPYMGTTDFNPNKLAWYFEIYKEGLESKLPNAKLLNTPKSEIDNIVDYLENRSITEYCQFGSSYNADIFVILSSYYRNILLDHRTQTIYISNDPLEWIKQAEKEDQGELMKSIQNIDPRVAFILDIIQLLKSRKV